jgi:hypothetical protein
MYCPVEKFPTKSLPILKDSFVGEHAHSTAERNNCVYAKSSKLRSAILVTPAAMPAAASIVRISTPAAAPTTAISTTAARFLRTRFVHLQLPPIDIHSVEIADCLGSIVAGTQLHKAESTRAPGFPVGNDPRRSHLVSFSDEKLQQAVICHSER